MRVVEVERLREDLTAYTADVFASLTRSGWQERAGWYLHGLMLDGRRKSIQPMAARLGGAVHEQALNHFVTNSPWPVEPVRARIAEFIDEAVEPVAWAIDDTGLLKCGTASPCVARQYTGTAGKITNCQIAVSVSMVTDTASCPVDWRLFVPESWDPASAKARADVQQRRRKAGITEDIGHREKWRLALDMVDELIGWGRRPPLIVADSGYGDNAEFRHEVQQRGLAYVVQVSGDLNAYPLTARRTTVARGRIGRPPVPRYRRRRGTRRSPGHLAAGLATACRAAADDVVAVRDPAGASSRAGAAPFAPGPGSARRVADRGMAAWRG
jgi:SRSO17 transposase